MCGPFCSRAARVDDRGGLARGDGVPDLGPGHVLDEDRLRPGASGHRHQRRRENEGTHHTASLTEFKATASGLRLALRGRNSICHTGRGSKQTGISKGNGLGSGLMRSRDWVTPDGACAVLTPWQYRAAIAALLLSVTAFDYASALPVGFLYLLPIVLTFWAHDRWLPAATARRRGRADGVRPGNGADAGDRLRGHHAPGRRRDLPWDRLGRRAPAASAGRRQGARDRAADDLRLRTGLRETARSGLCRAGHESRRPGDDRGRQPRHDARAVPAADRRRPRSRPPSSGCASRCSQARPRTSSSRSSD